MINTLLVEIKTLQCPECRTDKVRSETRSNLHVCGKWNEYRKFECGFELHFSPNCMGISQPGKCKHSDRAHKERERRSKILSKVISFVGDNTREDKEFGEIIIKVLHDDYGIKGKTNL